MALSLAERRRVIIRIASARQRPGSGSCREFLERRTCNVLWPDLGKTLGDIPWAVIGGVATRHYMPERATQDLDVLVHRTNSLLVGEALVAAGYARIAELKISGTAWRTTEGVYVDIVESGAGWVAEALARATANRDLQGLPILPIEYLVLMKFQAGRAQDLADISRMLGLATDDQRNLVRDVFVQYQPDGRTNLESLIELGRLETEG